MINKISKYLIGGLLILLILLAWQFQSLNKKYKREKADRERLAENVRQLNALNQQQTTLILTKDELTGKVLAERDSLANVLKIRPKTITKIVERVISDKDTSNKPVNVIPQIDDNPFTDLYWQITDTGKCFLWEADAKLRNNDLMVKRTNFEYKNSTTDIFYFQRKKVLFLRIGKKEYFHKQIPECGTVSEKSIEIIKK